MKKAISLLWAAVSLFANAKAPEQLFESYSEKTFITKKITLNEAKRLRILANAQLSGLNEGSPQSRIVDTHKLLMLLVELESMFSKEAKYFNSKQLLTRFYNLQLSNRSQEAELTLIDEIMKTQGPIKAIEYFNRYLSSLKGIEKPIFTGFAISLKCDLLNQLYITSEYEKCLNELYQVSPKDSSIVETQKQNQLRYYYATSAQYLPKAAMLNKEVLEFESVKGSNIVQQIYLTIYDLLEQSLDPSKLNETLEISNSLNKLDLTSNPTLNFNSKRNRSILFLKLKNTKQAQAEAKSALNLIKSSTDLSYSLDAHNSAVLLDLFFRIQSDSIEKNPFDFTHPRILSTKPICTQNLLHNAQVGILLHMANYKGELYEKLRLTTQECENYVGLRNQEGYIKTLFEIIQSASKNEIDKKTALEIQNKYNSIKNNFYSINYFDLIIDELLKKY